MDEKKATEPGNSPSPDTPPPDNREPQKSVKQQTLLSDSLMARMKRVDPNLIRRYHQKSGQ